MPDAKTILLVDDDHDVLYCASVRLQHAGYQTITADNGERCLAAATENKPDAILLDVRMPEMDGLAALAELKRRKETRQIPIVMLSAAVTTQQEALDKGARFFLAKPYEGRDLIEAVEAVVNEENTNRR